MDIKNNILETIGNTPLIRLNKVTKDFPCTVLAAVVKGYKCIFVTTDKQSKEKADILKAVGAEVIVCPTNVLPEDPMSYYSVAKRLPKKVPHLFSHKHHTKP